MDAFLLGLSIGVTCLASCAPVLVPYLLGRGTGVAGNWAPLLRFLAGRFGGYLLFGVLVWFLGRPVLRAVGSPGLLTGVAYVVLAVLLMVFAFVDPRPSCNNGVKRLFCGRGGLADPSNPWVPALAGLATGLSFCPPFLLALVAGAAATSLSSCLFFFTMFFLGTSVLLVPTPFIGVLGGFAALRTAGRMAAGVIGAYYLYSGIMLCIGGMTKI